MSLKYTVNLKKKASELNKDLTFFSFQLHVLPSCPLIK